MAKKKQATAETASDQEKRAAAAAKRVDKFKKLAPVRMNRALNAIAQVELLANRGRFTYDDVQRDRIITALVNAVGAVDTAFKAPASAKKERFTF